jgi:thiamine-phosphate pyrophosphorylase
MRGLYAIVDLDALAAHGVLPRDFTQRLLAARPAVLQLRAKLTAPRDTLACARELAPLCRESDVPFFVNDRTDLALLASADGVHVGQEDLDIAEVRRIAPALKVGVSTHDTAQLERALATRPNYVAFGPVFPTSSKRAPDPVVGLEGLARAGALAKAAGVPLVAIGGIDLERASEVATRADLGAVIGGLLVPPEEVTERARVLHLQLGGSA